MKKLIIIVLTIVGFTMIANASVIEIKDAGGVGYDVTYDRNYYAPQRYPYVCYDRRVRIFNNGYATLRYEGCVRSRYSCRGQGMAHFGRYPSDRASYRALRRCRTARPRFVD